MSLKSQNRSTSICLPEMKCQSDNNCTQLITPQCKKDVEDIRKGIIICTECNAWKIKVATHFVIPLEKGNEPIIKCQKTNCNNNIIINCNAAAILANKSKAFCTRCYCFWGCQIVS